MLLSLLWCRLRGLPLLMVQQQQQQPTQQQRQQQQQVAACPLQLVKLSA
jgi:hypothetical protein